MSDYNHWTDAELIQSCLNGDAEAWEGLINRYKRLIYSIPHKYYLTPEEAADVFQSVCLILLRGLEDLRDQSKLGPWLIKTTMRECWRLRAKARGEGVEGGEEEINLPEIPSPAMLPDEVVVMLERQQLVRQGLSRLPERCRRLLTMLFYEKEDWTYEQISRELGIPVSSIGPIRGRCLQRLKKILEELGFS